MSDDSSRTENTRRAGLPVEFWFFVLPGLLFLIVSGVMHIAERLEGALRQMTIEADMTDGFLPAMTVCLSLVLFFSIRERPVRTLVFQMLFLSILVVFGSLIADFLAAVAIQLIDHDATPFFSETMRLALQSVIVLVYFLWVMREHKKLKAAGGDASDGGGDAENRA